MRGTEPKSDRTFGKPVRLRGRSNFLETVKGENSKKIQGEFCRVYLAASPDVSTRFGIMVSRKVGSAVRRNRLKRIIREFLRNNKNLWPAEKMMVISLFRPVENEAQMISELKKILAAIDE